LISGLAASPAAGEEAATRRPVGPPADELKARLGPGAIVALALTAGLLLAAVAGSQTADLAAARAGPERKGACLAPDRVAAAKRYAERRSGRISFAVRDECGRLAGSHRFRVHNSASVVKVMMMVGYLNLPDVRDRGLRKSERKLLGPLIKESSNDSANRLYEILGERRIEDVARRANMRHFETMPLWGLSEITAGDQASFVQRLERYLPARHADYALGLMARVVDRQRWGMPRVKPQGWKIRLKGGWSGKPRARAGGSTRWLASRMAIAGSRLRS